MFNPRVILYHIIKLCQYKQINIGKQCFFLKKVQIELFTHISFSLCLILFFFQFRLVKRIVRQEILSKISTNISLLSRFNG